MGKEKAGKINSGYNKYDPNPSKDEVKKKKDPVQPIRKAIGDKVHSVLEKKK